MTALSLLAGHWEWIAGLLAAGFGLLAWRGRKQEGRAERDAEIAAANAETRTKQLGIERPRTYSDLTGRLRGKR